MIGVAGIVKAGMKFGGARAVAYFGSQFLSQELVASMMEKGTEALVDYAVSQATNETEAVEFAQTAVWSIEMLLNGANIVGVAGLIKDSGALSRKLSTTKCNIGAAAKAQFKNKESLQKLSSEKITAIAEERAAAITYAKPRIPNTIDQSIRLPIEKDCGIKMPDYLVGYTRHGLDRAIARDGLGISTESILDTWKHPKKIDFKLDNRGGNFKIQGDSSVVVVNLSGEVISVWATNSDGHRL